MDSRDTKPAGIPAIATPSPLATEVSLPTTAWRVLPELSLAALDAGQPDLTRLQMQLLANRGVVGAEPARALLHQTWEGAAPGLRGEREAVRQLLAARDAGLAVTVYGDFDVDGMTSCAVMALGLRAVGIAAQTHLPEREADGRGLNLADVEALAANGTRLIVTTDCGVSNVAEVERAHALGMRVIVTDHHPPHGAIAPADVLVNPRHPECPSPEKNLAGVGVAFRVVEALLRAVHGAGADPLLEGLLDLVAVGTIGDVVPMTGENWALVRAGLRRLNTHPRPGLGALIQVAELAPGTITERDVSFTVAPRLNAASRLGQPNLALDLLLEDDPRAARERAVRVQALNHQRQELSERMHVEARAQVARQMALAGGDGPALLVAQGEDWPLGIIGLVAGRLADDYRRPALAISSQGDECRGSVRGPVGFNLVETLARHAERLIRFGGHAQAAGFTVRRPELPALLALLREDIGAVRAPDAACPAEAPALAGEPGPSADELAVDCRLPLRSAGRESYEALRALAPYGSGFPTPLFIARGVRVARCWQSGPGGQTLRMALRDGPHERMALWTRQGAYAALVRALDRVDVVYHLERFARPDAVPEYVLRVEGLRPAEG